jgi:hypothetical protein
VWRLFNRHKLQPRTVWRLAKRHSALPPTSISQPVPTICGACGGCGVCCGVFCECMFATPVGMLPSGCIPSLVTDSPLWLCCNIATGKEIAARPLAQTLQCMSAGRTTRDDCDSAPGGDL